MVYPGTEMARRSLIDVGLGLFVLLSLALSVDEAFAPVMLVPYGLLAVVMVFFVLHGRERVRITADEVLFRSWLRQRAVPRSAIAQVVYVHDIEIRSLASYTVLLDYMGRARWRSTGRWPAQTITALLGLARDSVRLPTLSRAHANERWPDMLPWRHARPGRMLSIQVLGAMVAVFLGFLIWALIITSMV